MGQLVELKSLLAVVLVAFALVGCGGTPVRPDAPGVVFSKPPEAVLKAATDALVVTGFEIQKSESLYVEGFRPRRVGLLVGSGGETAAVWLEPIERSSTRVRVTTAKSLLGIAGQRNWDDAILEEMEKTLGKRQ